MWLYRVVETSPDAGRALLSEGFGPRTEFSIEMSLKVGRVIVNEPLFLQAVSARKGFR